VHDDLSDTESRGSVFDSNFNTIPRARSRIRTNPWLPSPKASPPLSPHCRSLAQTPDSAMDASLPALSDFSSDGNRRKRIACAYDSDTDSLLDQSFTSDDPLSESCPPHTPSPVNFLYEQALESTLEAPEVGRFVESRDALSWANRNSAPWDDAVASLRKSGGLFEGNDRRRASSEESTASTSTLTCSCIPDEENSAQSKRPLTEQKSLDSGFFSSFSEDSPDRKRSLREIRTSLATKVLRLRQEKHLVDEKIREAREEELIRLQHIVRFQRQTSSARKYVLLETLDKLRARLATQSQRLQECYDIVLDRQQAVYCRQNYVA
jgi:hypothetical protein